MAEETFKRARVLVADPPWPIRDKLPGQGRGAAKHYELLDLESICAFPLPELAPDCVLFLWRLASMQEEALRVARAWGFVPKTELVWVKKTTGGKRWFGMGSYLRAEHETALVAVRGRPQRLAANVRSTFEAPAGRHSAKPDAFYELVEGLYPGPYVELFARRARPGWECSGNECPAEGATL